MRRRGPAPIRRFLPLIVLLLSAHPPVAMAHRGSGLGPFEARMVEIAREGAIRRLQSPGCRQVLTDFTDASGRTLRESLARFEMEPGAYLATVVFIDGKDQPVCERHLGYLFTTRGAARVFVCKSFFEEVWKRRATAEVVVIHEMLHTLGLGENPPTSLEITNQVMMRCGR